MPIAWGLRRKLSLRKFEPALRRKPLAEGAGMREGDPMIKAAEGHIKVCRKQRIPTLRELVAQIAPENRYDEIPSGPPRGKESVESQFSAFWRGSPFSS